MLDGLTIREWRTVCRQEVKAREDADEKVKRMQAEILDLKQEFFFAVAAPVREGKMIGWWDSCCLSTAWDLGDDLVEAGRLERHPDGTGRRWFYRAAAKSGEPDD
jgi:hypothetical protein